MRSWSCVAGLLTLGTAWLMGCGGGNPKTGDEGSAGRGGDEAGGENSRGGSGGKGGGFHFGGDSNAVGGSTSTNPTDPCSVLGCGPGQACVLVEGTASCVNRTCEELKCSLTEECKPASGGGNVCVSIACSSDAQCPEERFCKDNTCVDDTCDADARRCDGSKVLMCASNGGGESSPYTCGSAAYFTSSCSPTGTAGCGCQDDWDCPAYTACESGVCEGTGVAPTCTLPPVPFEKVLPQSEMHWGGKNNGAMAAFDGTGAPSPFNWSNQVASTPIVANLDDDTGDGIIDELDFPEILFISHLGSTDNPNTDGVVRAIHGGGANKGKDYFATCGDPMSNAGAHWFEGQPVVQDCNPNAGDATSETSAIQRPGGMVAVGDIDNDGKPEIVTVLEGGGFMILDNKGAPVFRSPGSLWTTSNDQWKYPGPAIVNLDHAGHSEIIIGNRVFSFVTTTGKLALDKMYVGAGAEGVQHQVNSTDTSRLRHNGPVVCPADLAPARPGVEFVAGTTLYALPAAPATGCGTAASPCALDIVWDAADVNGTALSVAQREGFCAVADILGADAASAPSPLNPLDGKPEVVVVANGYLLVLDSATGTLLRSQNLQDGTTAKFDCVGTSTKCVSGGSPNIDDFDGDGFPEVATSMQKFYQVVDFQAPEATNCPAWPAALDQSGAPPQTNPVRNPGGACKGDVDCSAGAVCNRKIGSCVCLHNGWKPEGSPHFSGADAEFPAG